MNPFDPSKLLVQSRPAPFRTRAKPAPRLGSLTAALLVAVLGGAASFGAACAQAQTVATQSSAATPVESQELADIRARLAKNLPKLQIDAVRPSPIPGVYAVIVGKSILYSDASGRYVINGHMFDTPTMEDLTQLVMADVSRIDPKILPLGDSFTEVRGNGKRQLYVFSDPDCPFCKKLEHEFPKLDDVTIHVFLYPLVSIHPNARKNALDVWCASDRLATWQDNMLKDIDPPKVEVCDNPIDRNLELGDKLGFTGTPTIVLEDGRVLTGTIPAERLQALMDTPH